MTRHPDPIRRAIETVRGRVRAALAGETVARATAAVGAFVWVWLAVDRLLEPPAWLRLLAFLGAAAALVKWLLNHSLSALFTPLPDRVIAGWIERRWPELDESLQTAISESFNDTDAVQRSMLGASRQKAESVLARHPDPEVVDAAGVRPWLAGAGALLASFAVALVLWPGGSAVYLRRLALAEEPWPRRVELTADKFVPDDDGRLTWRVPRDTPLELEVRAALTGGHIDPGQVQARLRSADGVRSRKQLAAIGGPTAGDDAHQAYRMKIDRLRQDLEIRLRGGDARLGPLYVRLVPRPTVVDVELEVRPPEYTGGRPYRQPADALDEAPEGATLLLHASSNKPLARVLATLQRGGDAAPLAASIAEDGLRFTLELPPLAEGGVIEVTLLDQDGIDSQPAYRLPIRVKRDTQPRVEFALVGVGRYVTPEAAIATRIQIEDDHAVASSRLTLTVGESELAFPLPAADQTSVTAAPTIDLLSMRSDPTNRLPRLAPGERLQLQVVAEDRYRAVEGAQPPGPHTSSSQVETLTIVTAEDLVARLEERELNLRRTFEQTYDEARGAELSADRMDDPPAEGTSPDDAERRRRLAMSRLVEQLDKLSQDTASVGGGFSAIHQELANNRVQNDDLKDRIQLRIINPLRAIVDESLPQLQDEARAAADTLDQRQGEPAVPPATRQRLGRVVAQMQAALDEMKAVETYNEVLAMLRGIISEQQEISRKTGDARKASLNDLLLD